MYYQKRITVQTEAIIYQHVNYTSYDKVRDQNTRIFKINKTKLTNKSFEKLPFLTYTLTSYL